VVEGVAGGEGGVAVFEEGEADEIAAGDGYGGFALGGDAEDAALAVEAGGDVEVAVDVEGHALSAAETLIEDSGVAVAVDGVDGLVAAGGGAGDEERARVVEGEVVGGDGGFERGVDEDLATGAVGVGAADLEDGAGTVADEEVAVAVEGDAGGDAHAFGVGGDGSLGGDAVDVAFGAGAGVEVAFGVEGEAGGVHEIADEGRDLEVAMDFKDGDGSGLAARAGEGGVDVAVGVDGGVGYGVEILCYGDGDAEVERVAGVAAAVEDEVAGDGAFGDADGGAGGAAEGDRGGGVADGGAGEAGGEGVEMQAVNFNFASRHGRGGREAVEMRGGGGGFGVQEGTEGRHGYGSGFSVVGCEGECKCHGVTVIKTIKNG